ncbi:class I SAM-dependent methyltransferase [Alkalihalobacterium bogoriense]|uniref:class I SAM-dependent methyltransferase n=1 Tax=Alkalihalobacterium bogoriense TaxID=246272 RepID=UPI00047E2FD1|nr:class I SAM-dependent methyltransferase [Alkalihalobacterium bogoriense]
MTQEKIDIETLFQSLDMSAQLIKEEKEITYLEGLALAGDFLFEQDIPQDMPDSIKKQLQQVVSQIQPDSLSKETVRKAYQLAVLKGMKEGVQAHHALTPDAVALFMSYLVNKVQGNEKSFSLYDPAVGTANLVNAIMNHSPSTIKTYGFEVDETLVQLAFTSANLQQTEIQLFHEDSIRPYPLPPIDIVTSDLPVGFYPRDEISVDYQLKGEQGKSLIHHLMIERSFNVVKQGGFLFFIVPNFLFESEQAQQLHQYLKENGHILGLLQLPASMFTNSQFKKSILLLQKKGENVKGPKQALLAELPSFSKKEAISDMIRQIDRWFQEQLQV